MVVWKCVRPQAIWEGRWQSQERLGLGRQTEQLALWRWRGRGGRMRWSPWCWICLDRTCRDSSFHAKPPYQKESDLVYTQKSCPWNEQWWSSYPWLSFLGRKQQQEPQNPARLLDRLHRLGRGLEFSDDLNSIQRSIPLLFLISQDQH